MEPKGTVEIKFRRKDLEKTMQRLDKACIQIVEKLSSPQLNPDEKAEFQKKLAARQEKLLPMYHQVAIQLPISMTLREEWRRWESLLYVCILSLDLILIP